MLDLNILRFPQKIGRQREDAFTSSLSAARSSSLPLPPQPLNALKIVQFNLISVKVSTFYYLKIYLKSNIQFFSYLISLLAGCSTVVCLVNEKLAAPPATPTGTTCVFEGANKAQAFCSCILRLTSPSSSTGYFSTVPEVASKITSLFFYSIIECLPNNKLLLLMVRFRFNFTLIFQQKCMTVIYMFYILQ